MVENDYKINNSRKKIDSGKVKEQHKELNLNKILSDAINQINSGINLPGTYVQNKQGKFDNLMKDYESNNPEEIKKKIYNNNNDNNVNNDTDNSIASKSSNSDQDNMMMENNDETIARDNRSKTVHKKVNQVNLPHTSFHKTQNDIDNSMGEIKSNKQMTSKNNRNSNNSNEKSSNDEDGIGMENSNKVNHRDIEIGNGKMKMIDKNKIQNDVINNNNNNSDKDKDYDAETEETLDMKEEANVENLNPNETGNI